MSRQVSVPTPSVQKLLIVAPVNKGGTGADNTVDAATNLGGINASTLGKPGGPVKLQTGGTVDPAQYPAGFPVGPTLEGPQSFYISATHTLTISNYDASSAYPVSVTGGTVSISGNTITFVAPSSPGTVQLTVGSRTVSIPVKSTSVLAPTITTPTNNAIDQGSSVSIQSSAFAVSSGSGTHQSSDWELATDSGFTNVVQSSFNDTTNKTTWSVTGLTAATDYYLRVRYRDATLGYSDWSNTASTNKFTTKVVFVNYTEEAKLVASDPLTGSSLGNSVAITYDGIRVVIGAPSANNASAVKTGAAYVFLRTGTSWTQEAKILPADGAVNNYFGGAVSISSDGTRLVAASRSATAGGFSAAGKAYIYLRTGTSWAQEAIISASDPSSSGGFSWSVAMSADGTRVISGCITATAGSTSNAGAAYVHLRTGTSWAQEAKLISSAPVGSAGFGVTSAISSDGTRCAVGAWQDTVGATTSAGAAYIFSRSGTTWTQEAKLVSTTPTASTNYAFYLSLAPDATRLAVGSNDDANATGAAFIFVRSGTTWSLEQKIKAATPVNNQQYGRTLCMTADGGYLYLGAIGETVNGNASAGAVYAYSRTGSTWTLAKRVIPSTSIASQIFGIAMAVSGDGVRLIVGASNDTAGATTQAGSSFIYA